MSFGSSNDYFKLFSWTDRNALCYDQRVVKPKVNFSIRLPADQKERLRALAERTSLDPSDLIRIAVAALLEHADAHHGKILLPVDFDEAFVVKSWNEPVLRVAETPPDTPPKSSGSATT
jgi:hypothetical protein